MFYPINLIDFSKWSYSESSVRRTICMPTTLNRVKFQQSPFSPTSLISQRLHFAVTSQSAVHIRRSHLSIKEFRSCIVSLSCCCTPFKYYSVLCLDHSCCCCCLQICLCLGHYWQVFYLLVACFWAVIPLLDNVRPGKWTDSFRFYLSWTLHLCPDCCPSGRRHFRNPEEIIWTRYFQGFWSGFLPASVPG